MARAQKLPTQAENCGGCSRITRISAQTPAESTLSRSLNVQRWAGLVSVVIRR